MFELLSLIIIEKGGGDRRTHGLGAPRHQKKRGLICKGEGVISRTEKMREKLRDIEQKQRH